MLDAMRWSGLVAVSCATLMLAALAEEAWAGGRGSGRGWSGSSHSGEHPPGGGPGFFGGALFFLAALHYSPTPPPLLPLAAPPYILPRPAPRAQYWCYS